MYTQYYDVKPSTFSSPNPGPRNGASASLQSFADHYRDPWYTHHSLSRNGVDDSVGQPAEALLAPGVTSPWGNLSHTIYQDSGAPIFMPPDLESPENIARLRRDAEFAEETGQRADAHAWPTIGKRPERIERSYNPWEFPAGIRERLLSPARHTKTLLTCNVSLVDAV